MGKACWQQGRWIECDVCGIGSCSGPNLLVKRSRGEWDTMSKEPQVQISECHTIEPDLLRRERGQSIVEMAFLVPILLLLLVVVVDAARAFDAYIVLTNAVREGARFATIEPSPNMAQIQQLVVTDVLGSGTNVTHMTDFSTSDVTVDLSNATVVTVTAEYDFDLWFGGLVGLPTLHLEKQAAMPMYLWGP
jgi:Flp pilus assembly protein TadG